MGTRQPLKKMILTALYLGRVSNLPTVWTNVLTGVAICGGGFNFSTLLLMLSISLFYISGMYLNDVFDCDIDSIERPQRPIPAGLISKNAVFVAGFSLMVAGGGLLLMLGYVFPGVSKWRAPAAGILLAIFIVIYDLKHKANPLSPFLMGMCRILIYVIAGLTISSNLPIELFFACLVLLSYLIGLTYIAKQESLGKVRNLWPLFFLFVPFIYTFPPMETWETGTIIYIGMLIWVLYSLTFLLRLKPNVPRVVVSLIAGISLLDGLLIVVHGQPDLAWLSVGGFILTLVFQRFIPGT